MIIRLVTGLAFVVLALTPAVAGQAGPSRESFRPSFLRSDLSTIVDELALEEARKAVVEQLLFDYETTFAAAAQAARQRFQEMNPTPTGSQAALREDQEAMRREIQSLLADARTRAEQAEGHEAKRAIMDEYHEKVLELREQMRARRYAQQRGPDAVARREAMTAKMTEWNTERRSLRDEFVTNVEAVLTDEQRVRWTGVLRMVRRRELLGGGMLAGESVDLVELFRKQRIDAETATAATSVLAMYTIRLDEALVARTEVLESFGGQSTTPAQVQQEIALRVALRDVNVVFADQVAETLPAAQRFRFVDAYHEAAFPSIYRPTPVQRLFTSTKGRRTLSDEQRDQITDLEIEYLDTLVALNAGVRDATLQHEAEQLRERLTGRLGEKPPALIDPGQSPIRQAMIKRREAGASYTEQLQAMVGDVRTAYPKRGAPR